MPEKEATVETKQAMRLERLENHYATMKTSIAGIEDGVKKITTALLGNEFGDIGLVERIKEHNKKLSDIEKEQEKMKIYFKQAVWVSVTIGGAIIVVLIKYIFKGL